MAIFHANSQKVSNFTNPNKIFRDNYISLFRSEVFDRMLDSNMSEAEGGEVVVEDMDPDVLEKVVEYIYTGGKKRW